MKKQSLLSSLFLMARCVLLVSAALLSTISQASENSADPHKIVKQTTDKVLALLSTGIDPVKDPDQFITALSEVLDPVVAFNYIAKGVMGEYASSASPEQIDRFATAFKSGLVNTYGKGISGFQDLSIKVLPPAKPIGNSRRARVIQEITSPSGVTKVAYSMAKNKQGHWKMINLVLNGINFGQTFRGQFAAAVEKNDGNIDKTINEWEKGVQ